MNKRITDAVIENEKRKTDAFVAAAEAKEKELLKLAAKAAVNNGMVYI